MNVYKIILFILTIAFSGQSLEAVRIWNDDIRELDFKKVLSCLKKRKLIQIGDQEYAVCQKHPKISSKLFEKGELYDTKVAVNPCYPNHIGLGPRILTIADIQNLPDPLPSFYVNNAETDASGEFLTVNFMTLACPHWSNRYRSPVPLEKQYWNESHTKHTSVPYFFVSFLLKKVE